MSKASEWATMASGRHPSLAWSRTPEERAIAQVGWAQPEKAVIPVLELRAQKLMLTPEQALAFAKWIIDTFGDQDVATR